MYSQLNQAMTFAKAAHSGQYRKYTNEPYICHPLAVAGLVFSVSNSEELLSAAALHDVVEDTSVNIIDIALTFGHSVACLVADLTDISAPSDGNRSKRKGIDLMHTKEASPDAKTIKLADLIDNTKTIVILPEYTCTKRRGSWQC